MNRRSFFTGAAAVVTASLSPKLLSDSVPSDEAIAHVLESSKKANFAFELSDTARMQWSQELLNAVHNNLVMQNLREGSHERKYEFNRIKIPQ